LFVQALHGNGIEFGESGIENDFLTAENQNPRFDRNDRCLLAVGRLIP